MFNLLIDHISAFVDAHGRNPLEIQLRFDQEYDMEKELPLRASPEKLRLGVRRNFPTILGIPVKWGCPWYTLV